MFASSGQSSCFLQLSGLPVKWWENISLSEWNLERIFKPHSSLAFLARMYHPGACVTFKWKYLGELGCRKLGRGVTTSQPVNTGRVTVAAGSAMAQRGSGRSDQRLGFHASRLQAGNTGSGSWHAFLCSRCPHGFNNINWISSGCLTLSRIGYVLGQKNSPNTGHGGWG